MTRLIIETHFETLSGRRSKLGVHLILEVFCSQCEIRSPPNIRVFTMSDNRWSCGRSIFQRNRAIKTSKMRSLLDTKSNWCEDIWKCCLAAGRQHPWEFDNNNTHTIMFDPLINNLSQTDMILSKRRFSPHNFRRDAWQNLWSSGSYRYFDSQQNGAAIDVSAKIVSYSCFYWKKYDCTWGTKVHSGRWCNMSHICHRLMRCHWSFDSQWIKISGHSEQLRPCGSTSQSLSRIDTQESKLRVCLVLEVLAKLMVGENLNWEFPKAKVRLILEVHLILERRR